MIVLAYTRLALAFNTLLQCFWIWRGALRRCGSIYGVGKHFVRQRNNHTVNTEYDLYTKLIRCT